MELQIRRCQHASGEDTAIASPSSFVQQGTVDWPTLARASVNASVSILTRLSGCGVEPWTAVFAQVILGTFQLSAQGESHLNDALAKLYSFGGYGDSIYYGFGAKHLVRSLADSREGMAVIALCSSVTEIHGLAGSTHILQEYAKLYGGESAGSLMPSYRQWEFLMNTCSGVLSRSPFGSIVEFFMKYHKGDHIPGEPKQVALALEGLANISNGSMKSMILVGNAECGFLAAIAHWLLSLRVVVKDAEGDIVYPSTNADEHDCQVMVIYSGNSRASKAISRVADTYYVDSVNDLILKESLGSGYLSGRVQWKTAFNQTFGASARKLFQMADMLGECIGSAAKMFSDPGSWRDSETKCQLPRFGPDISGRAFVTVACEQVPELANSRNAMDLAVERSYADACLHFDKVISILTELCGCINVCRAQTSSLSALDSLVRLGGKSEEEYRARYNTGCHYCLRILALTIIQLIRQISTIASIPADLCPKRRGLELLYQEIQQGTSRDKVEGGERLSRRLLGAAECMSPLSLAILLYGVEPPFFWNETGYDQYSNEGGKTSVYVDGGLCFIMDSVMQLSSNAEEALRVHIIPGHIEWNNRIYTKIRDGTNGSLYSAIPCTIFPVSRAEYGSRMQSIHGMVARAMITESSDCLRMSYEIKTASGSYVIGPRRLSEEMAKAAQVENKCLGNECQNFEGLEELFLFTIYDERVSTKDSINGKGPSDGLDKPNIILFGNNHLAHCSVLRRSVLGSKIILQGYQCLSCCARQAMMAPKPNEQVIISRMTAEDVERILGKRNILLLEE